MRPSQNPLIRAALAAALFAFIPPVLIAQPAGGNATIIITNEDVQQAGQPGETPTAGDQSIVITNEDVQGLADEDRQSQQPPTAPSPTPAPVTKPVAAHQENAISVTFTVNGRPGYGPGMAIIVTPEEEITIEPAAPGPDALGLPTPPDQLSLAPKIYSISQRDNLIWNVSAGRIVRFLERGIIWESPLRSGTETIELKWTINRTLEDHTTPETRRELNSSDLAGHLTLHALVSYPFNPLEQTSIEGYPIGVYADPDMPEVEKISPFVAENRDRYKPPVWFVKVDARTADLMVSPHFKLGDFSPAAERGKTHFIALDYRLVDRLEALLARIQEQHPQVKSLKILRAFLTPNQRDLLRVKGVNIATFSRFLYGDAAVIIADADGDGVMDDLNKDGRTDIGDAEWIEALVSDIERQTGVYGGLGMLDTFDGPEHDKPTPCVMIDTRGVRSRWRVQE
ncbi:MAG: hypothetical protein Kow0059_00940 [Candidatus Sumerlaeia bacterium]